MDDRALAARTFERYAFAIAPGALCIATWLYLVFKGPQPDWWQLVVLVPLAVMCELQLRSQRRNERSIRGTAVMEGAAAALRLEARSDLHAWRHMGRLKSICSELERLEGPEAAAKLKSEVEQDLTALRFRPKWYGALALAAYFLLVVGLVVLLNR